MLLRRLIASRVGCSVARRQPGVALRLFSTQGSEEAPQSSEEGFEEWDDSEASDEIIDLESLEKEFSFSKTGVSVDNWGSLSSQDISEMASLPPYEIDLENPPKLKDVHYYKVKKIAPELYEEWVNLRTVQWKLQNKLKPLATNQFNPGDAEEYDKIPEWSKPKVNRAKKECRYCVPDQTAEKVMAIHFTNLELLHNHINERGMIINKRTTGTCGIHQRKVAKAIKRARLAGLLSFTSNWKIPETFIVPKYEGDATPPETQETQPTSGSSTFTEGGTTEVTGDFSTEGMATENN